MLFHLVPTKDLYSQSVEVLIKSPSQINPAQSSSKPCTWNSVAASSHARLDRPSFSSFKNQLATLSLVIDPENIPRGFNLLAPDEVNSPYLSDPLA